MSPRVSLERGLELMRAERWFDAHEALEDEWRRRPLAERDFLQGLVHVTVAWHHASKGNQPGASRQLEKAARRLGPYAPAHRGVDVARVLGQVEAASARVAEGLLDLPLAGTDLEERLDPEPLERAVHVDPEHVEPPEEQQQAEGDHHHAPGELDRPVVVPQPAERAHRPRERAPTSTNGIASPRE